MKAGSSLVFVYWRLVIALEIMLRLIKMNKFIQNIRNKIQYKQVQKVHIIDDDLDDDVTDEIEKALWVLKEDMDLPTEEIEKAVKSRKIIKDK
tara:strand:- start:523 stop:801 length:279 start_codon:yes stop_codon:yes gene_type:complete